ncbi:MAG: C13 family peptidase [Vicinamibacterales bacterium]
MRWTLGPLCLVIALAGPAAAQDSHLLVIVGLGGEPATSDQFHGWAATLVDAARGRYGLREDRIVYLGEDPSRDPARIDGKASRESIADAVGRIAGAARPGDRVFIVLFGHGASAAGEPRFNLPGPDMSAKDFRLLLDRLKAQAVTFVNTASASGGYIAALSGANRAVITATQNEGERNQTLFGQFFVEAVASADGDLDKDGRVSMLEAFNWAKRRTGEAYEKQGHLLTEHAVLDDDGDGKASAGPGQPGADGALARTLFLSAAGSGQAEAETADPVLKALHAERRAIEDRIAKLKAGRGGMEPERYEREMEQALIDLARKNREIREREKVKVKEGR